MDCTPQYAPTFDNLFNRTLKPTCGQAGQFCHAAEGAQNGLVFADIDQAYAALVGTPSNPGRVIPNDPACSLVMRRLASADLTFVMPPGEPLSAERQCVFQRWIEDGAER